MFSSEQTLALDQPVTLFFQMDPLILVSSLLSGHRLVEGSLWALGVLLATLCLGRVFCGFICPLGTLHHFAGWFRQALGPEALVKANSRPAGRRIKYFLLILLLSAALLGLNLTGLLDPISFLYRSVALAILPGIGTGIRELVEIMAASDAKALNHLARGVEYLVAPVFGYEYKAFQTAYREATDRLDLASAGVAV